MVAQTIELPNIRKLFIPDPGMIIADADLSGADAQVVAWEAGDEDLKAAFRSGIKIHIHNMKAMFPEQCKGISDEGLKKLKLYDDNKRMVHGTDYGGGAKTMASNVGWSIIDAERWQRRWFGMHPGILDWHKQVYSDIMETRSVRNAFGYRRKYFGRVKGLLPEALAWIPQSTVALITWKAAIQMERMLPWVEILLQVHDSLVFQYPVCRDKDRRLIHEALKITVPYADPLDIPWGLATSRRSWGDVKSVD